MHVDFVKGDLHVIMKPEMCMKRWRNVISVINCQGYLKITQQRLQLSCQRKCNAETQLRERTKNIAIATDITFVLQNKDIWTWSRCARLPIPNLKMSKDEQGAEHLLKLSVQINPSIHK